MRTKEQLIQRLAVLRVELNSILDGATYETALLIQQVTIDAYIKDINEITAELVELEK